MQADTAPRARAQKRVKEGEQGYAQKRVQENRRERTQESTPESARQRDQQALSNVSFSVGPGEHVVMLGANGSGKSTLARLANGLLLPFVGEVIADGISSLQHDRLLKLRRLVGLVTQDPDNQIVSTTVFDEVAFGPQNLGWEPDRIRAIVPEALEQVGLPEEEFAKRDPNSLSGGEKQRVVIAATLAMQPRYLVLDEPTAMLDPVSRSQVLEAAVHAIENGAGVLHITHHLEEAESADRVLVLERGRLVYDGAPEVILGDEERLTAYGLMARPVIEGLLPVVPDGSVANGSAADTRAADRGVATNASPAVAENGGVTGSAPSPYVSDESVVGGTSPAAEPDGAVTDRTALVGAPCRSAADSAAPSVSQDGVITDRPSLEFSAVSFSYPDDPEHRPVLEGFDLSLCAGECLLLVGASGSGKSTLLSLAAGLLHPSGGKVMLSGEAPVPGQVGLVFQQPEAQLFAQTLHEDILFGPKNLGMPLGKAGDELVDEVLAAVGLDPGLFRGRSPFSLSGGEARRAAIATTLALKTDFLLLDEPTAGLDARGRVFIYELLQGLLSRGRGIVIATHDPEFFRSLATGEVRL